VEIQFTNQINKQYFNIALIVAALMIKLTTLAKNVLFQTPSFTKILITDAKLCVMELCGKEFVTRAKTP